MGIFSSIANAIFGSATASTATQSAAPQSQPAAAGSGADATSAPAASAPAASAPAAAASGASAAAAPISPAQVESMIAAIEAKRGVKYNWRQSIVDLMKLLDLDSSLAARKELAQELDYKGALDGSAEMNTWLHKQVMAKLAASGGKVPEDLK